MGWKHTDRDHLHVSAMKVTLELVDILGDDALIQGVELTSTTVVREGAFAPTGDVLFDVHFEMVEEE
jgi:hypothetical protein